MITAINKYNKKVIAFKSLKEDGPFFCSVCKEEVVLKKGEVKLHHFSHKPSSNCAHSGESFLHESTKYEIYEYLNKYSDFSNTELEKTIGSSRADIYTELKGEKIAIEVQASTLTRSTLKERTKKYTDKGIYTLWVIPFEKVNSKDWIKYLSFMYFGYFYIWKDGKLHSFKNGLLKEVFLKNMFFIKRKQYKAVMEALILLHFEIKERKSLKDLFFGFLKEFFNLPQRG